MAQPEAWGDVVLARKETPTSYHLSVVVDDALQGVTHVVRGQDLFRRPACTACCRRCSDLPPPLYHHHRLVLDADGRKLVEIHARDRAARVAPAGHHAGGYPPHGRTGLMPLPRHRPVNNPTSAFALYW